MRCWFFTLALLACHRGDDKKEGDEAIPPIQVSCVAARAATVGEKLTVRGLVKPPPDRDALVAAAVPGRVAEVRVQEGDTVARGQLIAVVDDPALLSAQTEAEATVGSAGAAVETAKQAAARAQKLFDEGVAPRRDVEEANGKLAAATAELKSAHARAGLASAQRERAQVKAPRDGTIVKVLRRPGELVDGTAATAIVEIADVTALELGADAPAADLVRLTEGQKGVVRLDAVPGVAFPASVIRVAPGIDATTALGGVRVKIEPTAGARPRLGLAGVAELQLGERAAVLVPAPALRRSVDGVDQLVVCAGEGDAIKAAVRDVVVGPRRGDDVEIQKGVAAGERVVTDHALGVEDGAALAMKGAPAEKEPAEEPPAEKAHGAKP